MAHSLLTNIHTRKTTTENAIFQNLYMLKYVQQKKHVQKCKTRKNKLKIQPCKSPGKSNYSLS